MNDRKGFCKLEGRVSTSETSNGNTRLYFTLADNREYKVASASTKIEEFESIKKTEQWYVGDCERS